MGKIRIFHIKQLFVVGTIVPFLYSLTLGSYPLHFSKTQVSVDVCPMNGHKCCCPDRCRRILNQRRSLHSSCASPTSVCKIQPIAASSLVRSLENAVRTDRQPGIKIVLSLNPVALRTHRGDERRTLFQQPTQDVPTPPPKAVFS